MPWKPVVLRREDTDGHDIGHDTAWRRTVILLVSLFQLSEAAFAAQQVYEFGGDGLACPFRACGVEKKLKAFEGVEKVDIDTGLMGH